MFIGFTFSSLELCITIAALYSTATMLFGGFYANSIPIWLNWLRYGSIVYYGYLNMQMVEFSTGPLIRFVLQGLAATLSLSLSLASVAASGAAPRVAH